VSTLVFGTAALGLAYGLGRKGEQVALMPEADAGELVEAAIRQGIDVFDTAPAYGIAEERLGRILGARGQVWTKLGRHEHIGPALIDEARASLNASLVRLRRSSVELLQWHNWTADLAANEHFRSCWAQLASDPRIAALGASTYGVEDARAAIESGLFHVVQVEWNILNQGVVDAIAEEAQRRNVAIAVRSVFLQGALTDEARDLPDLPALREGVTAAARVARDACTSLRDLALRSALHQGSVRYVLMGIDRIEQITDAARVARLDAPDARGRDAVRRLSRSQEPAFDPRTWPVVGRT
jgi:aryl-alcohol dehydrogenase-like predicted oxidoreductase